MYETFKAGMAHRLYLQCQISSPGNGCQVCYDKKESKTMFMLRRKESHDCERRQGSLMYGMFHLCSKAIVINGF